ncbi:hypothetical protein [Egbenema bharatensis]|uniref:hypothetical protein n=1 Tax=Egbenema bharatensis TaxID=3463334 RepID=UPI003A8B8674
MSYKTLILGFSGVRHLAPVQVEQVKHDLIQLSQQKAHWHVGDATGVDALVRLIAQQQQQNLTVYEAETREPWQLQRRSKQMIDAIAISGGTLHAWVNKPCPVGLTLTSWQGSGTWGTVRYAHSKEVTIVLHWLCNDPVMPEWMTQEQLRLF